MELIHCKKEEKVHGRYLVQIIWVQLVLLNGLKMEELLDPGEITTIEKLNLPFLNKDNK